MTAGFAQAAVRRDRAVVMVGLAAIIALSWAYILYLAWDMRDMDMGMEMAMPSVQAWASVDFILTFVMWAVMMVAMMTPSASPMILMFSKISRQHDKKRNPLVATSVFLLGYLIVWTLFSAIATLAQWGLHSATLLSPMMVSTSPVFGGVLLIAAGAFQFTRLKYACLSHCRSPMGFFLTEWRDGLGGALNMGLRHGRFCVGCCWLLMALLFVAGVMNLLWVALIALIVLIEKTMPAGQRVSQAIGLVTIGWGIWIAAAAIV
jgi:predicted metal-binding membrane protein